MQMKQIVTAAIVLLIAINAWAEAKNDISLGINAMNQGDLNAALKSFTKAIESDDLDKPTLAKIYFARGTIYQHLKKYENAIENYSMSIDYLTKDPVIYHNRALAYYTLGMYDLAVIEQ